LTTFQGKLLQKTLQDENLSDKYRQRIQIMLLADEGKTQAQICQQLGCSPITVRHWITMARTGQANNWLSSPLGRPKVVNDEYLERLKELVTQSPKQVNIPNTPYKYVNTYWTANKLSQHLQKELGIELSDRQINRLLKEMGLSSRPKRQPRGLPFEAKPIEIEKKKTKVIRKFSIKPNLKSNKLSCVSKSKKMAIKVWCNRAN
jgi:transposase